MKHSGPLPQFSSHLRSHVRNTQISSIQHKDESIQNNIHNQSLIPHSNLLHHHEEFAQLISERPDIMIENAIIAPNRRDNPQNIIDAAWVNEFQGMSVNPVDSMKSLHILNTQRKDQLHFTPVAPPVYMPSQLNTVNNSRESYTHIKRK